MMSHLLAMRLTSHMLRIPGIDVTHMAPGLHQRYAHRTQRLAN